MMISTQGLNGLTIYHSITLAAAIITLVFSVASMMMPFSQLAIAELYAVQDDNHKSNNVAQTASTRTMMTMPSTSSIATKKNSTFSNPYLDSIPVGKNCKKDMDERPNPIEYLTYFNCGHVTHYKNGTILRQFSLIVTENK